MKLCIRWYTKCADLDLLKKEGLEKEIGIFEKKKEIRIKKKVVYFFRFQIKEGFP